MAQMFISMAVIAGGIFYFAAVRKSKTARIPIPVKTNLRRKNSVH